MARTLDVAVPDIGDYKGVPVIEILVKDGQRVEKDAALLTLESEKATMEVPAPDAGVVRGIRVKVGDKVSQGDVLLQLEHEDEAASRETATPKAAPAPAAAAPKPAPTPATPAPAPAAGSPKAAAATVAVTVPEIGDYRDVPVIEVLVKDGAQVEKDAPLIVLESDKATMEVPAPSAGTVRGMKVKVGDKVSPGDVILQLESAAGEGADRTEAKPARAAAPAAAAPAADAAKTKNVRDAGSPAATPWAAQAGAPLPHASPSIRKTARELGVDLARVTGTGRHGRILLEDLQAFVRKSLSGGAAAGGAGGGIPPIPAQDFTQFGEVETRPLARIRKLSAAHLHRAWLNVPHVTQFDEADITELEAFRKAQSDEPELAKAGVKLTLLPFVMKAVAAAMKAYPEFNSSLAPDGESLILKKYCHIGFAADTPNGLVVPVVRNVDQKGIVQLAAECAELAKKARDGKLKSDEMKGGCFSISSLGGIGGSHFTPIVNAPEVAILGVSRAQMKPVWDGKAFAPRLMCPLSLSYDHRVIDGAYAARFIVHLVKLVSDLRRLAL